MITQAQTDAEILATFEVMAQLRPHLTRDAYVARIRQLMASDGFRLAYVSEDGVARAVAGYRVADMLHCGRFLSVDDLVADERVRSRGHGKALLDWLKAEARREGCGYLELISSVVRQEAHRFYFREGLAVDAFHFRVKL
ncbi:GCN5 family acetyltransferase [Caulobacter sp. Root1455]|uniref:GNAT family N-acetyltransferase n=1 Tax=Caulobacter sp. Root1455 TaxID=1736465 RepID=UPI0006F5BCE1|nr:GNAT family N-acetyltransferase [Caulobacter sp. Root1455]KQZ06214.1 GCN5 family acetyltransferase [Caulobacter sp. Root1455]